MSDAFDAMGQREIDELRAWHPGIAVRILRETLGGGPGAQHCVALDIRGPEFQEIVSGPPSSSAQKALAAAMAEAQERLRSRAARQRMAMRVVLACQVPDPMEIS